MADFWSTLRQTAGNTVDDLGTALKLPELGISEAIAGGKTTNTKTNGGNTTKVVSNKTTSDNGDVLGMSSTAPSYSGGTTYPALDTAAVNNTQTAIDQIPALLARALANEAQSHSNTMNGYQASEDAQRDTYNKSTETNQKNYDSTFMDSIRAGIQGLGSLISLLRGTGAAGGTAEDNVRDVVGGVTSDDIRNGENTQQSNQASLDSSLSSFLTDLKAKRQAADDTYENNKRSIQSDSDTKLQDLYSKMAGYYSDSGNTNEYNNFMSKAGSLTPAIAENSSSHTSAYDTTPVAVNAPELTAFSGPSQPNVATAPSDGQVGSGIFTMSKRKSATATAGA